MAKVQRMIGTTKTFLSFFNRGRLFGNKERLFLSRGRLLENKASLSMTMTMTPMTPTYFCHRSREIVFIIICIINNTYNNATANDPYSEKINAPTVITVIVIAVIVLSPWAGKYFSMPTEIFFLAHGNSSPCPRK